jgi:predicted  nucleic acid-binding Zn-ribbon protein
MSLDDLKNKYAQLTHEIHELEQRIRNDQKEVEKRKSEKKIVEKQMAFQQRI